MAIQKIIPSTRMGMNATPSESAPESASETFLEGAILVENAGRAEEGGVNPTDILGVAAEPGDNNSVAGAGTVRYIPAIPSLQFEGTLSDDVGGGYTSLAADLLQEFGLTKATNNNYFVDKSKTGANGRVRVRRFKDPVGTVDARVLFEFSFDHMIQDKT
ncbi:hypothetical protein IIA15_07880 [candidate division TA06 bacterium]|nr:hypothetical protein [candidate division TA06 bacterium]